VTRTLADGEAPHRRITVAEVRAHRNEIVEVGIRHGVTDIRVFGSVARGEADERSDLDLLVGVCPGRNLFDLASFAIDVEDLLGIFTQVVTERGIKARIRARVLSEAVPL